VGNYHPSTAGLNIDDIALDCLGTLFERNTAGEFRLLRHYYESAGWTRMGDEELMSCTRRLVFSRVHQELCRLWKQGDPSLQKLVRNLKNALRTNRRLISRRIGHDTWVFSRQSADDPAVLPVMSAEYFEAHLAPLIQSGMSMRDVTSAISIVLGEQLWYRKGLPLIGVALGIRNAFVRLGPETVREEEPFPEDCRPLLNAAVHTVRTRMSPSYVGRGKVDESTFTLYLESVFDILHDQYILGNGDDRTFYDYLSDHRPEISRVEYRRVHQSHLEYLVKLAKQEFFLSVQREFG
jgi:hypothetical protein